MKRIAVYVGDFIYNIDCTNCILDSSDNTLEFFDGICFLRKIDNNDVIGVYKFERLHIEKFLSFIVENLNDE